MDQQKSAKLGCFIASATHVSYKTVPNILPWGEKHHLASTSFDQKYLCPEQIPAFDPWWCMRHHGKSLQLLDLKASRFRILEQKTTSSIGTFMSTSDETVLFSYQICCSFMSHLEPKTCWSPFALLTTCSRYLHIILQPTMVPWVHCRQLNNWIFWVQIWSKYNEARGNLKAARITATMNSQLWHMHRWWILWLVSYCPNQKCLAHSYFWFDFGRAPGSNSLKCAAIASWKARIHALSS